MSEFDFSDFFNYYVTIEGGPKPYPSTSDPPMPSTSFYTSVLEKREFSERLPTSTDSLGPSGGFLPHQQFMARFLSPHTTYNRMLAFHGVGTGKTVLYVAVSEEAFKIDPSRKTLVLVSRPNLKKDAFNKIIAVTKDKYKYVWTEKDDHDLALKMYPTVEDQALAKEERILKKTIANIHKFYTILTYLELAKEYRDLQKSGKSPEEAAVPFSTGLIVIDEAHHLKSGSGMDEQQSKVNVYFEIHKLLHHAQGAKILLLTGTPMRDDTHEIVDILNLLLPLTAQLKVDKKERVVDQLLLHRKELRGIISYIRPMDSVQITEIGEVVDGRPQARCEMSAFQTEHYLRAWEEDTQGSDNFLDRKILWLNTRNASVIVFPDGSWGPKGEAKYMTYVKRADGKLKSWRLNPLYSAEFGTTVEDLAKFSAKFYTILTNVIPGQKAFVYCSLVHGSGALVFAALLQHYKYDLFSPSTALTTKKKRYAIITGYTADPKETLTLLNNFNNPLNDHGEYCQIVIGSHVIGEGVDFTNIRQTFVVTPFWNDQTIDQAIGRSIRSFSHTLVGEKTIDIYRLVAVPTDEGGEEERSIDSFMYAQSLLKDKEIKEIELVLKKIAVDCVLNRGRNILPASKNNSRECDYQVCDYECDEQPPRDLRNITDTYNLFYADTEIKLIFDILHELFKFKSAYQFTELWEACKAKMPSSAVLSKIVLSRALYIMSSENHPIVNRNGFVNYCRANQNMYFLVDDTLASHEYTSAFYADKPYPQSTVNNFEYQVTNLLTESKLATIQSLLLKNSKDIAKLCRIFATVQDYPSILTDSLETAYFFNEPNEGGDAAILAETLMTHFKHFFHPVVVNGKNYVLNTFDPNFDSRSPDYKKPSPRYYDYETGVWNSPTNSVSSNDITMAYDTEYERRIQELRDNAYKYYIVESQSPCTETTVKIKEVIDPKWVRVHGVIKEDEKESKWESGQVCSTFDEAHKYSLLVQVVNTARTVGNVTPLFHTPTHPLESLETLRNVVWSTPAFKTAFVERYVFNNTETRVLQKYPQLTVLAQRLEQFKKDLKTLKINVDLSIYTTEEKIRTLIRYILRKSNQALYTIFDLQPLVSPENEAKQLLDTYSKVYITSFYNGISLISKKAGKRKPTGPEDGFCTETARWFKANQLAL
jgi:superfamily II DNA or RNA helicase